MEITQDWTVPESASRLHKQGRTAGRQGEYARALELLDRAHAEAPEWPYPVYDAAFTYLLMGDTVQAEKRYAQVDRMAPGGFFTSKTTLDTLRRELRGELPEGFAYSFAMLEFMTDEGDKKIVLEGIVERFPKFAPAWKQLATMLQDSDARLQALNRGLEGNADYETRGQLLLNKAFLLRARGEREEAIRILNELALDPDSTTTTLAFARAALEGKF